MTGQRSELKSRAQHFIIRVWCQVYTVPVSAPYSGAVVQIQSKQSLCSKLEQ